MGSAAIRPRGKGELMNAKSVRVCALLGGMAVLASACGQDQAPSAIRESRASPLAGAGDDGQVTWGSWSTAVPVEGINSLANENHPAISKNGLSLYFTSDRKDPGALGGEDIWVSHRANLDDPWGKPVNLGPKINSGGNDRAPNLTSDGHFLYFHSNGRGGYGGLDLFVSRRQDVDDDLGWEQAVNLGGVVNGPFDDAGPTIFEDDETGITTLYFTSNRPGGPGDFDVYASTRAADDKAFGPAVLVPELSGPFRDTRTAIRHDGLEIFLSSDSAGRPGGFGSQDIWVSTRSTTSDLWSAPKNLGPNVNTPGFDGGPALSFDGTTLYFFRAVKRANGSVDNDLYVTTRTRTRTGLSAGR
jgi:Tol biopolymer transport system component